MGGVAWAYLVNARSFAAVIVGVLMMQDVRGSAASVWPEISLTAAHEGLRFVFSSPMVRSTMRLGFFATFFSSATAMRPIFAQDVLRVGAHGYGLLYAAPSAGALAIAHHREPAPNRDEPC